MTIVMPAAVIVSTTPIIVPATISVISSLVATAIAPTVMAAIVFPMVGISGIAAVADYNLIVTASVPRIPVAISSSMVPWVWLINYHFIAIIKVIVAVTGWQTG